MVRSLPLLLILAACSQEPERTAQAWQKGRDGLCLAGDGETLRAGLVVYGADNANCSLAGSAARTGDTLVITPKGEGPCRVEVTLTGETAVIGRRSPACAYYCGPGADYSGRKLRKSGSAIGKVADLAGDRLC